MIYNSKNSSFELNIKQFTLTRDVTQEECPWLEKNFSKDETVFEYVGPTYNVISLEGIACSLEWGKTPFFELPKDALR